MKATFTHRINFSDEEFQDEYNNFNPELPTFEEVSTEVTVVIENGAITSSNVELTAMDERVILTHYEDSQG